MIIFLIVIALVITLVVTLKDDTNQILFVAVGEDLSSDYKNILYSYDGIKWETSSSRGNYFSTRGLGVGFGFANKKPRWVAVGEGTDSEKNILYSNNGKFWNKGTGSFFNIRGNAVAYGNERWVAVGNTSSGNNHRIKYSDDGKNWSDSANNGNAFTSEGYGVAYGNGRWVAVGSDTGSNGKIMYSDDGIEWNVSSGPFSTSGQGVAYGNGRWIAVGEDDSESARIKYSDDNGESWNNTTPPDFPFTIGYGIAYSEKQKKWVAVGHNISQQSGNILYSDDNGITWNRATLTGGADFYEDGAGVTYEKTTDTWVAVGDNRNLGSNILYSKDGIKWIESSSDGEGFNVKGLGVASRS